MEKNVIRKAFAGLVAFICIGNAFGQVSQPSSSDEYVPGAFYVKFEEGVLSLPKSAGRNCPVGYLFPSKSVGDGFGLHPYAYDMRLDGAPSVAGVYKVVIDSLDKSDEFMRRLQADPRIEIVERVPLRKIVFPELPLPDAKGISDDPLNGEVDSVRTSWHLEMVGFDQLYGTYKGNGEVRVAVVDNAVWGGHEDLQLDTANLYNAADQKPFTADPPSDVDQTEVGSYLEPSTAYHWSHGTHCAGLIGALTDNGVGISSLAGGVTVLGVRTSTYNPIAMNYPMEGVIWAVEHGAKVISMSYGSSASSTVEKELFGALVDRGIVLVAAAGNESTSKKSYPAAYPGVISVGSLNSDGSHSYFTNYGSWVKVWSPGGFYMVDGKMDIKSQIFSTTYCVSQYFPEKEAFSGKFYDMMIGTSMATPLVSSAVALILSYYPDMNGYQILEVLEKTAKDGCIYVPDALRLKERNSDRQVLNLQAMLNPDTRKVYVTWDLPKEKEVQGYEVYKDGELMGMTTRNYYTYSTPDTSGSIGVRALYSDGKSLSEYVRIRMEENAGNGGFETSDIKAYVDYGTRHLRILSETDFDRVEIYDIRGVRVLSAGRNADRIALGTLRSGLYIARIFQGSSPQVFKFVL